MLHELSPTVESRALLHFPNNLKGGGHCADWATQGAGSTHYGRGWVIRSICWGALSSGSDLLKCVMARAGQSRGPYHSDQLQSWPTEVRFTSTASTVPPQSAPKWEKCGPRAASISIACVKGQAICSLGRVNWISDLPTAPSMGGTPFFPDTWPRHDHHIPQYKSERSDYPIPHAAGKFTSQPRVFEKLLCPSN